MSNITQMVENFTIPNQMKCFKYHYPIYIPAKFHDGTKGFDFINYQSTGACNEDLTFKCDTSEPVDDANRDCSIKTSKNYGNGTLSIDMYFDHKKMWHVDTIPDG